MTTVPAGAGRPETAGSALPSLSSLMPSSDELVDALALTALTMIGIVGFRPAYGGHAYLAAGAAGVLLGLLLSHFGQRARLPLLAVVAVSVLAFVLFGGVISETGTVSLATLRAVTGAAVSGWQQLLTTGRPVGSTAGLLTLPYLLGLFGGVAGYTLARRTSAALLPAIAPAVVVALSILFGAAQPTAAALQGAGFAVVALGWAAVRQRRGTAHRATIGRQRLWQRIGLAACVLGVAGAGATVVGPHLPGAGAHHRVVLSVVPPFDVTAYPSPLAGFRDYTKDVPPSVSVYGKELFATTGLPAGSRVRIAAMDAYDGLAWGVANASASGSFGGFQRVGTLLPGAAGGHTMTATITIEPAYDQPWLPDLAGTTGFVFPGPTGATAGTALRFNVATTTGVIPGGVPAGLRYTVSYDPAPSLGSTQLASATPDGVPDPSLEIPSPVQAFAQEHADSVITPMGKVLALASYLQQHGTYSDGGTQSSVLAGHGAGRLTTFLESKQIVGDDEQYAAAMALLANAVGVPARVSLDGTVQPDGAVYGKDVHADVELDLTQYGWVTLPAASFTGTRNPIPQPRQVTPPQSVRVIPPRQNAAAPVPAPNSSSAVSRTPPKPPARPGGFAIPAIVLILLTYVGIPLLVVIAVVTALIAAKAVRRRRRRGIGPPAVRVAGAWREFLDLGRDLGIGLPASTATRREQAARAEPLGLPAAGALAAAADAAVFGPADPDDAVAARVWTLTDEARHGAMARLSRRRRAWVAVNPAGLFGRGQETLPVPIGLMHPIRGLRRTEGS
jgi:Transglutaminase-like superfamily